MHVHAPNMLPGLMALLQVRFERTVVRESRPADVASVRLLLRVDPLMDPVGFVRFETLPTHFALEVPCIGMNSVVLLQLGATLDLKYE